MIEFHAGTGPDSRAVGIALEEMFLDYRLMPGRAPLPVIAIGGARLAGSGNILMALARKTGRFLPGAGDASRWLEAAEPDLDALDAQLAEADFIAGAFSIADMAVYPWLVRAAAPPVADSSIGRWMKRMARRPAARRGLSVIAG